ncbi:hypothetical protein HYQ44_007344 [Verticillium longisporum]|nr:hypothetical protein HYQ44_007344 [Verticillium longisporum]
MKDGTGLQMSLPRMVTKPLASLFWTFALFSIANASDQFKFTGHLARFVPNCASECLISFLNDNFAEASCDTTTSLECLCAETGTSGFTIGEGAVQCIEAEQSIGSCAVGEIGKNTIDTAYFMCSDQPRAALPTHTAIEAIFIIPATGGGRPQLQRADVPLQQAQAARIYETEGQTDPQLVNQIHRALWAPENTTAYRAPWDDGPAPSAPTTHHDQHQYHWHPQQHLQQQRPDLPRPNRSDGSSSCSSFSSLATKRLGSERAAGLALQSDELAAGSRWRRNNRDGEQENNNTFSRDEQSLQPPTTPGWHPTLTPTRRGDDLFLDVR